MKAKHRARLGARIRGFRRFKAWSQEGLAEASGLHRTYVGAIERGERNVSLDNIVRLAHALGVSASELVRGIEGDER